MRIIEKKKINEAEKEEFRIIANDKLSSNKAVAQVKAVLSKYDKFNKINREVLMKDKSGSGLGFRMASGRSSIFLFPNQLIAVYN